jgi:hypothetical protein
VQRFVIANRSRTGADNVEGAKDIAVAPGHLGIVEQQRCRRWEYITDSQF